MKTINMLSENGKALQFRSNVSILDDDVMGFSLYNECGEKWESASMRTTGMEHYAVDIVASGLVFNRNTSKAITEALKHIVEMLDKYNTDGKL